MFFIKPLEEPLLNGVDSYLVNDDADNENHYDGKDGMQPEQTV